MAWIVVTFSDFLAGSANDLVARLRAELARYLAYRRCWDELDQLSDRELLDLGLSRHDLRAAARDAVYGC